MAVQYEISRAYMPGEIDRINDGVATVVTRFNLDGIVNQVEIPDEERTIIAPAEAVVDFLDMSKWSISRLDNYVQGEHSNRFVRGKLLLRPTDLDPKRHFEVMEQLVAVDPNARKDVDVITASVDVSDSRSSYASEGVKRQFDMCNMLERISRRRPPARPIAWIPADIAENEAYHDSLDLVEAAIRAEIQVVRLDRAEVFELPA